MIILIWVYVFLRNRTIMRAKMKFQSLLLIISAVPVISYSQTINRSQPIVIIDESKPSKPAVPTNAQQNLGMGRPTILNSPNTAPQLNDRSRTGGIGSEFIGNSSIIRPENTVGSTNTSAKPVPQYGPIPVTPELMSALTTVSQKQQQVVTAADQQYKAAVDQFKYFLHKNGDQLVIVTKPASNSIPPIFEYYVNTPNGSLIEVSNSVDTSNWTAVGSSTLKTVSVYDAQTGASTEVLITIKHPGAKAEMFARADVPLTPQLIEDAFAIALYRGNVYSAPAQFQ